MVGMRIVAIFILVLLLIKPALSQALPTCISISSDTDGDGYGWENNQSCVVDVVQGRCEDRGDYPWGWNPATETSCRLDNGTGDSSGNPSNNTSDATADCIDTDGDGWGWNENTRLSCLIQASTQEQIDTTACIDVDGDGWGWNGTETCTLELETLTVTGTDLKWGVCREGLSVIEDGEIEGIGFAGRDTPLPCIRQCSRGTSTVALPDYPGWGYDNQLGMQCVIMDDLVEYDEDTWRYDVPVYVVDEEPKRLVFEDQLLYPLYTANGIWECNEQSRDGVDQPFTDIGSKQFFQFMNVPFEDRSELRIWNANTGLEPDEYKTGFWSAQFLGLNYTSEARYLSLWIDGTEIPSIGGYMQIDGDNLKMYKTPFSRQNCQRTTPVEQSNLPSTFEQIEALNALALNELLDIPLQCTVFEKTNYLKPPNDFDFYLYSISESYSATPIDMNVQFIGVGDYDGLDRVQLAESVGATQLPLRQYTVSTEGVFSASSFDAIGRFRSDSEIEFKQFGADIIRVDHVTSGWQDLNDATTFYQCN